MKKYKIKKRRPKISHACVPLLQKSTTYLFLNHHQSSKYTDCVENLYCLFSLNKTNFSQQYIFYRLSAVMYCTSVKKFKTYIFLHW